VAKQILYVEPVGSDRLTSEIARYIEHERAGSADTHIDVVCLGRGPRNLEYRYYQAAAQVDALHRLKRAEREGYDAAVIGCYYDPWLEDARELVRSMVVVAPAEASMHVAATLGRSFSVLVGREKWVPQMYDHAVHCGFGAQIASFETIGARPADLQGNRQATEKGLMAAAKRAVKEKGAEVLILGGTLKFGFYRQLQDALGVPVIDSVLASIRHAEFLVDLQRSHGWAVSRICGLESPPSDEISRWGLEEQYAT